MYINKDSSFEDLRSADIQPLKLIYCSDETVLKDEGVSVELIDQI